MERAVFVGLMAAFGLASAGRTDDNKVTVTFSADRTDVTRRDSLFVKRYMGNVVVRMNPEVWLTADEATYDGRSHEAVLTGSRDRRVTIVDSGRTLRANRVTYLFKEHRSAYGRPLVWLRGNVLLEDSSRSIEAPIVRYRPESDSVAAYGRVHARQPGGYLLADTLLFDAKNRGMLAAGSIVIVDSAEDTNVRAGWYRYEREDSFAVVARSPVLTKGHGDTAVVVTADSMRLEQGRRRAVAWGNVQIVRGSLNALCDSVAYDERAEKLALYGNPQADQRTESDSTATVSRLYGRRIAMLLDGTKVRRIEVEGLARAVASEVDSSGAALGERWIIGRKIVFHVEGERITEIEVFGEARSRYVPTPAARRIEGINEASGDTIRIGFRGGRMSNVRLSGGAQGIYWPPADSARTPEKGMPQADLRRAQRLRHMRGAARGN